MCLLFSYNFLHEFDNFDILSMFTLCVYLWYHSKFTLSCIRSIQKLLVSTVTFYHPTEHHKIKHVNINGIMVLLSFLNYSKYNLSNNYSLNDHGSLKINVLLISKTLFLIFYIVSEIFNRQTNDLPLISRASFECKDEE